MLVLASSARSFSAVLVREWPGVLSAPRALVALRSDAGVVAVRAELRRGVLFSSLFLSAGVRGVERIAGALGVLPRLLSLRGDATVRLRLSGVRGDSVEERGELRPEEPRGDVGEVLVGVPDTRAASLLVGRAGGVVLAGVGLVVAGDSTGGLGTLVDTEITVSKVSVLEDKVLSSRELEEMTEEVRDAWPRDAGPLERIMLASSSASASTSSLTASSGSRRASS